MTVFCPISAQAIVDQGRYQIGATIMVFDAGTLTPRQCFKDGLAITPWLQAVLGAPVPPNALVTDGSGRVPLIWVVGNPYRVRIISATGTQLLDIDNLPGDVAAGGGGGGGTGAGSTLQTGDYVWAHGIAGPVGSVGGINGRVRANGRTIGNASSSGTERAANDTFNLFVFLYTSDATLTVSGGRSGNPAVDWNSPNNKTIALPDLNGRCLFGVDGMGASPSGRLNGVPFAVGDAHTMGSSGGEGVHVTTVAEMPVHGHTGTTLQNLAFSMTGSTNVAGVHSHGGATVNAGSHSHTGLTSAENANHTHSGTTDLTGSAHQHTGSGTTSGQSADHTHGAVVPGSTVTSQAGVIVASAGPAASSNTSGTSNDHTHSYAFTTPAGQGSHTHSFTTATESASHAHAISADGDHVHAINADPGHAHSITTNAGGVHTHNFTTANAGSGAAHNTTPPFVLATAYLIL